jgi:hypothetical protein
LNQIHEGLLMGWTPIASFVMAGLRPGHPRLSRFNYNRDVDARHKAGHDDQMIRYLVESHAGGRCPHRNPVPPQRWHFTTLSPFLSRPLPSQFLHCFENCFLSELYQRFTNSPFCAKIGFTSLTGKCDLMSG